MLTKNPQKIPKYICEKCNIITNNKKDFNRHLSTAKHHKPNYFNNVLTETAQILTESNQILEENPVFECKQCNKKYNSRVGLWYHKKKCQTKQQKTEQNEKSVSEDEEYSEEHSTAKNYKMPPSNSEIIEILKVQMLENHEFKKFMMEQQKQMMELALKSNITNNINTNSNCNNNNNTFNLQFFLNEKCKDALNINEFVDSIKIQMSDLEKFSHLDYPDGVSKIFVKNLNNVDTYLRPIHCSDLKREVLYIKDNNEWIKESDDKPLLKNAIKQVAFKNIKLINEWVKEHPGCQDPTTKQNVKYNKIVMNSMSGGTVEEQHNNLEQIVKNVTKAVVIDKYAVK